MQDMQDSTPDPIPGDLFAHDPLTGLDVYRAPLPIDPVPPDLQPPPEAQLQPRPDDLAEDALTQMHQDLTYQQLDNIPYTQVFMDQHGTNDTRRRHFDLLMSRLDATASQES